MRIKKHPNKNHYLLADGGHWVRDFTRAAAPFVDVNDLTRPPDYKTLLDNELRNRSLGLQRVDTLSLDHKKVVIASDGHGFADRQRLLAGLPPDVAVIAVNGALAAWRLLDGERRQKVHYYVVNNPYPECMRFFPGHNRYFPRCLASVRTNPEFTRRYAASGTVYSYSPTPERNFAGMRSDAAYRVDDYRNPVCAAIGLAYRMNAERLLLFCCDDSFADPRPGSEPLANGLHAYPQHAVSQGTIDANLHWFLTQPGRDTKTADHSSWAECRNAPYIGADDLCRFFGGSG